jgi:hypothetical protein
VADELQRGAGQRARDVDVLQEAGVGHEHVDRRPVAAPLQSIGQRRHAHHRTLAVVEPEAADEAALVVAHRLRLAGARPPALTVAPQDHHQAFAGIARPTPRDELRQRRLRRSVVRLGDELELRRARDRPRGVRRLREQVIPMQARRAGQVELNDHVRLGGRGRRGSAAQLRTLHLTQVGEGAGGQVLDIRRHIDQHGPRLRAAGPVVARGVGRVIAVLRGVEGAPGRLAHARLGRRRRGAGDGSDNERRPGCSPWCAAHASPARALDQRLDDGRQGRGAGAVRGAPRRPSPRLRDRGPRGPAAGQQRVRGSARARVRRRRPQEVGVLVGIPLAADDARRRRRARGRRDNGRCAGGRGPGLSSAAWAG